LGELLRVDNTYAYSHHTQTIKIYIFNVGVKSFYMESIAKSDVCRIATVIYGVPHRECHSPLFCIKIRIWR